MTQPPTDREALIAALAAETRLTGTDEEPEPEKILDFLAGRLEPDEEESLSRHLLAHPEASRALLDLAELEAAGAEAGKRPADLAALAGWRDLERRLPSPATSRFRQFFQPRMLQPAALAAALLVSTIGLGTWVWRLQGELNRPVANLPSVELSATREETEPAVMLPPGAPLHLVISPVVRCPGYKAILEGPKPGDQIPVRGLVPDARGLLNPQLRLNPGSYGLKLYGCEPQQEAGNYRFTVTPDND
jgi:hypothetical protein